MSLPPPLPVSGIDRAESLRAESELHTLATLYTVMAALQGLMLLLVGGLLAFGVQREATLNASGQSADQAAAGMFAIGLLSVLLLVGLVSLVLKTLTARALRRRQRLLLCNVTAVVTCLGFPLGTVLGIWTLLALQRPATAALFGKP
ncbi:hypothetical protein JR065_04070 [Xanthomonas sp. AmX2]|uniref:hypothetical protein n=1 Tax=Xanthomonas sp. TaxID=29446 RepID=UPI00198127DA|nr:hypothetical protein [Xanthomonas sp.]MBN6149504.1 hypothetical protein [Xanthomonas sp.]